MLVCRFRRPFFACRSIIGRPQGLFYWRNFEVVIISSDVHMSCFAAKKAIRDACSCRLGKELRDAMEGNRNTPCHFDFSRNFGKFVKNLY